MLRIVRCSGRDPARHELPGPQWNLVSNLDITGGNRTGTGILEYLLAIANLQVVDAFQVICKVWLPANGPALVDGVLRGHDVLGRATDIAEKDAGREFTVPTL